MTKLLEQAVADMRELPDDLQDKAARHLINYVSEVSADDRADIDVGRLAYQRGDFTSLDQLRHDLGIGDH